METDSSWSSPSRFLWTLNTLLALEKYMWLRREQLCFGRISHPECYPVITWVINRVHAGIGHICPTIFDIPTYRTIIINPKELTGGCCQTGGSTQKGKYCFLSSQQSIQSLNVWLFLQLSPNCECLGQKLILISSISSLHFLDFSWKWIGKYPVKEYSNPAGDTRWSPERWEGSSRMKWKLVQIQKLAIQFWLNSQLKGCLGQLSVQSLFIQQGIYTFRHPFKQSIRRKGWQINPGVSIEGRVSSEIPSSLWMAHLLHNTRSPWVEFISLNGLYVALV